MLSKEYGSIFFYVTIPLHHILNDFIFYLNFNYYIINIDGLIGIYLTTHIKIWQKAGLFAKVEKHERQEQKFLAPSAFPRY